MLTTLLNSETIQLVDEVSDWEAAIRLAAQPLISNESITHAYIEAMIASVHELGPYIIITPKVALPHARPEKGALKLGLSLLRVTNGVKFSDDPADEANLIIALAANDNSSHIQVLTELADLLESRAVVDQLIDAVSGEEIIELISKIEGK